MKILYKVKSSILKLLKFFWIKYTPEHIANTLKIITQEIVAKGQKESDFISLKNADFFEGEFLFLSFFYFAAISRKRNIYDNDFVLATEHYFSKLCAGKDKTKENFIKKIIKNRFSLYREIVNQEKNIREEIENVFFVLVEKDIKNQGYSVQNISALDLAIVNPFERIFLAESLRIMLKKIDKIFDNVKIFESN